MALEETRETVAVTITCDVYGCKTEPFITITTGVSAPRTYAEERTIRTGWRVRKWSLYSLDVTGKVGELDRWACPTHAREELLRQNQK